jgi:2'-5' RNA ligase
MPKSTRTFVALEIPARLGEKLARLQARLEPEVAGVRWTAVRPFHVTLAFLGDVADTDLHVVCRAVAEAAAGLSPCELALEGLGAFPHPARARILWVGVGGPGLDLLGDLQQRVARSVAGVGYAVGDAPFHAHVTLGRLRPGRGRPPANLAPILAHFRAWSAGSFSAAEIVTLASTLTREGPVYARLGHAPLRAGKPGPPA